MSRKYSLDELKQIFREYREIKHSRLTNDEFDLFCRALRYLPKEIVDKLNRDVDFILLSAHDRNAAEQACIIWLNKVPKDKKALIILTPIVFEFLGRPKGEKDSLRAIIHEVGHYHLGARPCEGPADFQRNEMEVEALVQKWVEDFADDIPE